MAVSTAVRLRVSAKRPAVIKYGIEQILQIDYE